MRGVLAFYFWIPAYAGMTIWVCNAMNPKRREIKPREKRKNVLITTSASRSREAEYVMGVDRRSFD
jgi:hypothetical protein